MSRWIRNAGKVIALVTRVELCDRRVAGKTRQKRRGCHGQQQKALTRHCFFGEKLYLITLARSELMCVHMAYSVRLSVRSLGYFKFLNIMMEKKNAAASFKLKHL